MPVSTFTDRSGTITAGGAAQTISADSTVRRGFTLYNASAGDLWFNVAVAAVLNQPSIKLISGALYETPPNANPHGLISIIGATTGQAYTCKEW